MGVISLEKSIRECYISPMKPCTKCGEEKPFDAFGVERRLSSGRQPHCRDCATKYRKRYRRERPHVHRKSNKGNYERNHPRVRARHSAWWKANKEKGREYGLRKQREKPEITARASRKWRVNNQDRVHEFNLARRARKVNAPGSGVNATDIRSVMDESLGICAYCNERKPLTVDHIEPLARGGAHDPSNLAAACSSCNSSKKTKPLIVWLAKGRRAA